MYAVPVLGGQLSATVTRVAQLCEIDECGIFAIGRCRECGRAFCRSHQEEGYYGVNPHGCAVCHARREAPRIAREQLAHQRAEWVRNGARKALQNAGRPTLGFYTKMYFSQRSIKTAFRTVRYSQASKLGEGWRLGTFGWIADSLGEVEQLETMLPVNPAQANAKNGLVIGIPMSGRAGVHVVTAGLHRMHEMEKPDSLFDAVRRIVGNDFIPVELR